MRDRTRLLYGEFASLQIKYLDQSLAVERLVERRSEIKEVLGDLRQRREHALDRVAEEIDGQIVIAEDDLVIIEDELREGAKQTEEARMDSERVKDLVQQSLVDYRLRFEIPQRLKQRLHELRDRRSSAAREDVDEIDRQIFEIEADLLSLAERNLAAAQTLINAENSGKAIADVVLEEFRMGKAS